MSSLPSFNTSTTSIMNVLTQSALSNEARAEVNRILVRSVAQGRLDDNDRAYLAQVVATRTGLSPDEAQRAFHDVTGAGFPGVLAGLEPDDLLGVVGRVEIGDGELLHLLHHDRRVEGVAAADLQEVPCVREVAGDQPCQQPRGEYTTSPSPEGSSPRSL